MWSPTKRYVCLALALALLVAGCGFKPMYGAKGSSPEAHIAGVKVETLSNDRRMAQQFRADLEDRLNPSGAIPANPQYRLSVSVKSYASPIGVARDGTVSRYNVYLDSDYSLFTTADNKEVAKGSLRHVSSYNNLTNQYFSTFMSEQDALKRGVTELSELYRQRLSPFLAVN